MPRTQALLLDEQVQKLMTQNAELMRELNELKGGTPEQLQLELAKVNRLLEQQRKKMFGASTEKKRKNQAKRERRAKAGKGHGPNPQDRLPLDIVHHELPKEELVCDSCGGDLKEWPEQAEGSQEIHVLAREYVVRHHQRKKYRCKCGACIKTAPAPKKLFKGARYSPEFAVEVAVAKYADHLPLTRQVKMMERDGLVVTSQTLWDQLDALSEKLWPLKDRLHQHVLGHPVIGADETTWKLLNGGKKSEGELGKHWYVWAIVAPNAVSYTLKNSRSSEAAAEVFAGFNGTAITDGYTAYQALRKQGMKFKLANCWSHVRRKYIECENVHPEQCGAVLDLIGKLYEIESSIRGAPPDERMQARQEQSKSIVAQIQQWALETEAAPGSPLRAAIEYMGKLWPGLKVFLDNPLVDIDNNATERALRGVVVGRKNHYGSRSERGTEVAALMYSLIESAKLCEVDPREYLRHVIHLALSDEPLQLPHELAESADAPG